MCVDVCDVCAGDVCVGDVCVGDVCVGDVCVGDVCVGDVCVGDVCVGDVCVGDVCVGDECVGDVCVGDVCVGDVCVGDVCVGDVCVGDVYTEPFHTRLHSIPSSTWTPYLHPAGVRCAPHRCCYSTSTFLHHSNLHWSMLPPQRTRLPVISYLLLDQLLGLGGDEVFAIRPPSTNSLPSVLLPSSLWPSELPPPSPLIGSAACLWPVSRSWRSDCAKARYPRPKRRRSLSLRTWAAGHLRRVH